MQIDVANKNIKLAANFLQRCPSCFTNLVRHICDFTCSPNQSSFMRVQEIEKGADGKKLLIIYIIQADSRLFFACRLKFSFMYAHYNPKFPM